MKRSVFAGTYKFTMLPTLHLGSESIKQTCMIKGLHEAVRILYGNDKYDKLKPHNAMWILSTFGNTRATSTLSLSVITSKKKKESCHH